MIYSGIDVYRGFFYYNIVKLLAKLLYLEDE